MIAGPDGTKSIPAHGCPVFSLGEPYYTETMLAKGYKTVVGWFQEVAGDPAYVNPVFEEFSQDESEHEEEFDAPGIELNPVDEVE